MLCNSRLPPIRLLERGLTMFLFVLAAAAVVMLAVGASRLRSSVPPHQARLNCVRTFNGAVQVFSELSEEFRFWISRTSLSVAGQSPVEVVTRITDVHGDASGMRLETPSVTGDVTIPIDDVPSDLASLRIAGPNLVDASGNLVSDLPLSEVVAIPNSAQKISPQYCEDSSAWCTRSTLAAQCRSRFNGTYSGSSTCPPRSYCGTCTYTLYLHTYCLLLRSVVSLPFHRFQQTESTVNVTGCFYPFASLWDQGYAMYPASELRIRVMLASDPFIDLAVATSGTSSCGESVNLGGAIVLLLLGFLIATGSGVSFKLLRDAVARDAMRSQQPCRFVHHMQHTSRNFTVPRMGGSGGGVTVMAVPTTTGADGGAAATRQPPLPIGAVTSLGESNGRALRGLQFANTGRPGSHTSRWVAERPLYHDESLDAPSSPMPYSDTPRSLGTGDREAFQELDQFGSISAT